MESSVSDQLLNTSNQQWNLAQPVETRCDVPYNCQQQQLMKSMIQKIPHSFILRSYKTMQAEKTTTQSHHADSHIIHNNKSTGGGGTHLARFRVCAQTVQACTRFRRAVRVKPLAPRVEPHVLKQLIQYHKLEDLEKLGGVEGLASLLGTDLMYGLDVSEKQLHQRPHRQWFINGSLYAMDEKTTESNCGVFY